MSNRYWLDIPDVVKAQIDKLTNRVRPEIKQEIADLRDNPRPTHALQLRGSTDRYRIAVYDHRILYSVNDDEMIVHILKVGPKHGPEFYQ